MDVSMDVDDALYARVFNRAPIYDPIFSCLSPRSLTRLAWTCRAAYLAVAEFENRAFNINRHLSRYFANPIAFRSLQARTDTLVSGSNALQFLDRTLYPEADLDLYTHPGHSFEVAQFLVEKEGYNYVPREMQEDDWQIATRRSRSIARLTERRVVARRGTNQAYPTTDISGVWNFEKTGVHGEQLKIQIIQGSSSALETILGYHSTCVMNFISSTAAYSLYPVATFDHRSALGMPTSRTAPTALQKYMQRGWRIYSTPTPDDHAFFVGQARWVSDKHTWRLPLDQTGVQARPPLTQNSVPLLCDPVLFNGWMIRLPSKPKLIGGFPIKVYECHYYPLKSTVFRYNYAIPDEQIQLAIRDWASQQGQFSHSHVSKEDWVWFDADIPSFLKMNEVPNSSADVVT